MDTNKTMRQLEVTPLDDLKQFSQGELVEFPEFAEGQSFVARVKRPSMMVLMKTGKIPNSLLTAANALFGGTEEDIEENPEIFKDILGVIEVLAEASFVEPTWKELEDAEIELTDEQYMFLFNYIQKGVKALESFRKE